MKPPAAPWSSGDEQKEPEQLDEELSDSPPDLPSTLDEDELADEILADPPAPARARALNEDAPPAPEADLDSVVIPHVALQSRILPIVEHIFTPGQVHLIGGGRGTGKTAFEAWMCGKIKRGEPFLGHRTNIPCWWGCLILDRGSEDRYDWWRKAGVDPNEIPHYSLTDSKFNPNKLLAMTLLDAFKFLEELIEDLDPPEGGVLTIDVANFFTGDSKLGYRSGFGHGWALNSIAHKKNITILAVMHGGKQITGAQYMRATDRIIASSGFLGAVGTVAYLTSHEESGKRGFQELFWDPHHHGPQSFKLYRTHNGLFTTKDLLGNNSTNLLKTRLLPDSSPTERVHTMMEQARANRDWRTQLIEAIPFAAKGIFITTGELVKIGRELFDVTHVSVHNALNEALSDGRVLRAGHGKWVRPDPPSNDPPAPPAES